MLGADFYAAAAVAIVAWAILFYVLSTRSSGPARAAPAPVARWHLENRVPPPRPGDALVEQQFRAVLVGSFEKRRLLNAGEYRTFRIIEDCVAASRRGYRVFAQTNLGEILASPNEEAFRSINSKRVDILIVDSGGWPVLAVEFQGRAHYQKTAALRDAVKKEALVKAGVGYAEVFASDTAQEIQLLIREHLGGKPRLASAQPTEHA
jgi:hypothetical protein